MKNRSLALTLAALTALSTGVPLSTGAIPTKPDRGIGSRSPASTAPAPAPKKLRVDRISKGDISHIQEPAWMESLSRVQPNESFLQDTSSNPMNLNEDPLKERLVGEHLSTQLSAEYEDMTRQYRMRKNYDLTDPAEDRSYLDRLTAFTRYVLVRIFQFQVKEGIKKAEKNSDEVRTFKKVHDKVEAVTSGAAPAVEVDESFKIGTQTNLRDSKGRVWVQSAVVDGAVDIDLSRPEELQQPALGGFATHDRYRFSLSRSLPIWELSSGVSYGVDTTLMRASLSRKLSDHLSAELATSRPLGTSYPSAGEETLSVIYGIQF